MKAYRTALLRKEFPFIDRLIADGRELNPTDADSIDIKRADNVLMARKGRWEEWHSSQQDSSDYVVFFAVEGPNVIQLDHEGELSAPGKHRSWTADTIGEQLFANGLHPDWIVEIVHNDYDVHGGSESYHWTIYKMDKFDLLAYHQQQIDRAAEQIKTELVAACGQR